MKNITGIGIIMLIITFVVLVGYNVIVNGI